MSGKSGLRFLLIAAAMATALAGATASGAIGRDPMQYFFEQSFGDLREEAQTARKEDKIGLFVMFNDPDCPWCQKMKATVLNQPQVQEYYRKHFRPVHLDTRGDTEIVDFAGKQWSEKDYAFKVHRVRATPVFLFLDLKGNVLFRYTGATRSVEEFMWLGEFVAGNHYKHTNFTAFKRQRLRAK